MKPELRPISITIVDFLGVFLPGTVWLVLFATFYHLILDNFTLEYTPILEIKNLLAKFSGYSSLSLLLLSVIIGYLIKPSTTKIAEFFYGVFPYIGRNLLYNLFENGVCFREWCRIVSLNDYKLPFKTYHQKFAYYNQIINLVNKQIISVNNKEKNTEDKADNYSTVLNCLPKKDTQPFSVCKRILREISPSLWEEAERREAEVRMLGSFFVATIFSLFCSLFSLIWNPLSHFKSRHIWTWFLVSLLAALFLRWIFGKQKKQEVTQVYMNFLVANSEFLRNFKVDSKDINNAK